jgi:hypothetical protein
MKKLLVFVIAIASILTVYGQEESDTPFKRCNTIKVIPKGDADSIMVQFAAFLEEEGYSIRRINEKKTNLRTAPFNMISHKQTNAIIHVMTPPKDKDNFLTITAFSKPDEYGSSEYRMRKSSDKFSLNGLLFKEVDFLANKFADTYNYTLVYMKNKH